MTDSAASSTAGKAAPAPAPRPGARTLRFELLLLGAVVAAQLLPLVLLRYLPTQDGPSHQALAYAMRVIDRPEGAPLREYLMANDEALPNWFVFFLQAKVLAFLSVRAAEKVLVAAYVVLLPLGLRYALRAIDSNAGFLAALSLPFTYNFLFGMGFLNFCFSLAAFFFAFGFYIRGAARFSWRQAIGLALLAAWVYFCHPVTLVMLLLAVGTFGCWQVWLQVWRTSLQPKEWWRAARERLVLPLLSLVPVLLLLATFVGRRLDRPHARLDFTVKLKHLLGLYSLVSFDRCMLVISLGLAALLGVLALLVVRQRRREGSSKPVPADALLAVAALFTMVYFAAPSTMAGGGFLNHRLALFPPLTLVLWLASARWSARVRWMTQLAGILLATGMLVTLWARWSRINVYLDEYVATADLVEDGRTVLPLAFAPQGVELASDGERQDLAFRVWPFVHALGYVAGRHPIVDLGLYEAGEDYFPLRFRPELDPYRHLSIGPLGMEEVPPRVDLPRYQRQGGRVDYVVVWQPQAAPHQHPTTKDLYRQLELNFERAHVSAQGNAELWRRRSGSPPG